MPMPMSFFKRYPVVAGSKKEAQCQKQKVELKLEARRVTEGKGAAEEVEETAVHGVFVVYVHVKSGGHQLAKELTDLVAIVYIISQSSIEVDEEMEVEQMVEEQIEEEEETNEEEIEEEELYETIKYLLMAIQAVVHVLKEFIITFGQPIERPLNRRSITMEGYNYIHKVLKEDRPEDFLQSLGSKFGASPVLQITLGDFD
ncbi:hypothetical protein D8674_004392 [Pyrus ussuriensis x Pyrus communis]|uniref:Uncharacterized protein n=1 Tax=Pyrus ussuriensis x Pyrus communis TaxID=2448454 RepID=A0A5N5FKD5_9ROSA|nr:hypothetical protein D8674_004392 [Pyrus ussuriensis x Pyrus communis]